MSKHTPTPWSFTNIDTPTVGYPRALVEGGGEGNEPEGVARLQGMCRIDNAERIVACVNACEGIDRPEDFVRLAREFLPRLNAAASEAGDLRDQASALMRKADKLESEVRFVAHTLSSLLVTS